MKEHLANLVKQTNTPLEGRNLVRDYLQVRILESLQKSGAMIPLAFHGGTALRFLFSHGRYSEDLDFALEGKLGNYDFRGYLKAIRSDLTPEGYQIEIKADDQKTVNSAFIRFPGLLYELGLSPMPNEVLAVKMEVDTNPPKGREQVYLQQLSDALLFFNFITMIKHRCFLENSMRYCNVHTPRDAIFMICFGI